MTLKRYRQAIDVESLGVVVKSSTFGILRPTHLMPLGAVMSGDLARGERRPSN